MICSTHEGNEKCAQEFVYKTSMGRDHLGYLNVDEG
jgi:hypothetical protein